MNNQNRKRKKILFLSFNYPYGKVGASTMCSFQIMKALCASNLYEVHCTSYEGDGLSYEHIPEIIIHKIPNRNATKRSKIGRLLQQISLIISYPIQSIRKGFVHYKYCIDICRREKFDLVVAQYLPEQCLLAGVLLKKNRHINNLMVIFWDIIYGKLPQNKLFNQKFAIYRQRKVETRIAEYADLMVSLYPIEQFHKEHGDVKNANGKRFYLGIPSVLPPEPLLSTEYLDVIDSSKINILFSGIIIKEHTLKYMISLLNCLPIAKDINLVFFSKGVDNETFDVLRKEFTGTIINFGYIPLSLLHSVYHKADFFLSLPGYPNSIRSKCYDYMSYGHPIILMQEVAEDVNIKTFSKYPLSLSINMKERMTVNTDRLNRFLQTNKGRVVPFADVERTFTLDTPQAYVNLIDKHLSKQLISYEAL